jgi:hypothetical protein
MKIYVNGDSFTAGDGLADPETFPGLYPGHHTMAQALDRDWAMKRSKMLGNDLTLLDRYIQNNQKYVWSTVLAELVNATVVNNAIGGSCMMGIATRTIADLELIRFRADLPDYVFIGLTNSDRLGHYHEDVENVSQTFNWVKSSIPSFWHQGHTDKYKKLFDATWATLSDEEFLINYLKECLQIKNYVKRRIGRDPIFLNTTYSFWQFKQTVTNSKNQWLRMLWFDLLEFDKIDTRWFNKGKFETMTACGHVLPNVHSDYARDLARAHFGWGKSPVDKDAE